MNTILSRHKPKFESVPALFSRAKIIKAWMKDNLRMNELKGDEKYGIVSHSMIIATLTAKGVD